MRCLFLVLILFTFGCEKARYVSQKDAEAAMRHVANDVKQLEQRISELEAQKARATNENQNLTNKQSELHRLLDILERKELEYRALIQKHEKDKQYTQELIDEQRRAINSAEAVANGLRQRVAELEAEAKVKELQAKIDELEKQVKALKEKERQRLAELPTSQGRPSGDWTVITPNGIRESNYPPGATETEIARRR
jgi:uncharacterized phage infection (PIP) family protein YhgE